MSACCSGRLLAAATATTCHRRPGSSLAAADVAGRWQRNALRDAGRMHRRRLRCRRSLGELPSFPCLQNENDKGCQLSSKGWLCPCATAQPGLALASYWTLLQVHRCWRWMLLFHLTARPSCASSTQSRAGARGEGCTACARHLCLCSSDCGGLRLLGVAAMLGQERRSELACSCLVAALRWIQLGALVGR